MRLSTYGLFVFLPVTLALDYIGGTPASIIFFSAALTVIPIAHLIVRSTEQIAARTGDAIGGLLNATFGNAPELIIGVVALKAGLFDMVRASLIGAILANLLLGLGIAFLLGGIRFHDQEYNPRATRVYSSMMLIAVISMIVPSTFSRFLVSDTLQSQEQHMNLAVALILLASYALYLLFMVKTHPEFFASERTEETSRASDEQWGLPRAVASLVIASALAAWMSEILVGAATGMGDSLGMSQTFIGLVFLAIVGGAAESMSAIAMARKNKMDLTVGIAIGSCIQIALFVTPVLVLASYLVGPEPLRLSFSRAELGSMFFAVLIGTLVSGDGRSNWYKGVQLITVYAMIALLFYFLPIASSPAPPHP